MPITAPKDTLAYHLSRPLSRHRDLADIPCGELAGRIQAFMGKDMNSGCCPETEAIQFYLLNHGLAEVRTRKALHEPLGPRLLPLVEAYYELSSLSAIRAFYYLTLICTRESRHVKSSASLDGKIASQFGPEALSFNKSIRLSSSAVAYDRLLQSPPAMPLGPYVESLRFIFHNGSFASGYGGAAWGKVTDCLVNLVTGVFSAEMMLDTVWTLAHNGGPIFNKGMLYAAYGHTLIRILDVQRSGQIPQAVLGDAQHIKPYATDFLVKTAGDMASLFGLPDFVDWYAVEALGAVHSYADEKAAQAQLHGVPKDVEEKAKTLIQQQEAAKAKAAAEKAKKYFTIMPGLEVPTFQPVRAAA